MARTRNIGKRTRSSRYWRSNVGGALVIVFIVVSVILIFAAMRMNTPQSVRPVSLASGEWQPFAGEELDDGGPVVSLMTNVLQIAGYEPQVSFTSWAVAEQRASSGAVFGAFPLVSSESRREQLLFSEPLLYFDYALFVRTGDSKRPQSERDLSSLKVGGIEGYDYWPEFESATGHIKRYPTTVDGLVALEKGEIDVLAEGRAAGEAALRSTSLPSDISEIETLDKQESWAHSTEGLYFTMAKGRESEKAMKRINEAIVEVKSTAEYRSLVLKLTSGAGDTVELFTLAGRVQPVDATPGF